MMARGLTYHMKKGRSAVSSSGSRVSRQRIDCAARKGAAIALLLVALATAASGSEVALQTIYEFFPSANAGLFPSGWLVQGGNGDFYGTTMGYKTGNVQNYGTVFKISAAGVLTNLFSFDGTNGWAPSGLIRGSGDSLYGVTASGGSNEPALGRGTIFKITTNGTLTTLFTFNDTNGAVPVGPLATGPDGAFYGLTREGGTYGFGTAFKITTNGTLTTLHSFDGTNGGNPTVSGLTLGSNGSFYGTTQFGGGNFNGAYTGLGTIFSMTTGGALSTLVYFDGTNGSRPAARLTPGTDQTFYGTTTSGGAFGFGTIFGTTAAGALTNLFSFSGTNGAYPYSGVTQGRDGNYYGLTAYRTESTNSTYGTVFKFATNGALSTLAYLDGTNGRNPFATLTLGGDGNLYGAMADVEKHYSLDGSAGSIFRLVEPPGITSIARPSGAVTLTWSSFTNGIYRVQYKPSVAATSWADLGTNTTATGGTTSFTDVSPGLTERYYRVVLLP
jgi:uncharacterized repeat protein (TIGR03803 family)